MVWHCITAEESKIAFDVSQNRLNYFNLLPSKLIFGFYLDKLSELYFYIYWESISQSQNYLSFPGYNKYLLLYGVHKHVLALHPQGRGRS